MPSSAASAFAHFLQFRIQYASIALVYYDYALTFPAEVKYIWTRKFHFTTIPYVFCRYALVANVVYVLAQMHKLGSSCNAWYKFDGVISVLGRAALIVIFSLRTYAISGCNKLILLCIGSIGLACFVLDIMHVPGLRCVGSTGLHSSLADTTSFTDTAEAELAVLMCVFEFLSLAFTMWYSVRELRVGRSGRKGIDPTQLHYIIFKQGLVYFSLVSIFTISASVLQFKAPAGTFWQRLPNALTLPLSCLLTARFILQMREVQHHSTVIVAEDGSPRRYDTQSSGNPGVTLSAMQAVSLSTTSTLDSVILRDFGDGPVLQEKGKEKAEEQQTGVWTLATEDFGSAESRAENTK